MSMSGDQPTSDAACGQPDLVRAARARLGVDRLVVSIHQVSFPAGDDDLGYGTPCSAAGGALCAYLADLGATGVALGPDGVTAAGDPSPYVGSALARDPLGVALGPLAAAGLLDERALAAAVADRPDPERADHARAWLTQRRLLRQIAARIGSDAGWAARRRSARAAAPWLAAEARFEALAAAVGHDDWRRWPGGGARDDDDDAGDPAAAAAFELGQLIAADQHAELRARLAGLGLAVAGDLAAGISARDRWVLPRGFGPLFLPGYAMGAPPSRTNPDGQPWDFPVLDPRRMGPDGAARAFLVARADRVLGDHDGLRVDHPHGWVCPWVYRTGQPDPVRAVQAGARLFESPDLPDHPELAALARVRPDQLDRSRPRHDDAWVRALEPAQIEAYAAGVDLLVERVHARGRGVGDLMVEVLSTCPRPLAAVLARHGLGRFRVTQKARVDDPDDVYRGDRAAPADWIMIGNHDTPPLGAVLARWRGTDEVARRAAYLAGRLAPTGEARAALAGRLERDQRLLATAMLAELFLGPARNVLVFWADLFGVTEPFNRPGVVDRANWSLRVPPDFAAARAAAVADGRAPALGAALAWALEARGLDADADGRALAARLRGPA
jgi:4-alpha-glucanotransferase